MASGTSSVQYLFPTSLLRGIRNRHIFDHTDVIVSENPPFKLEVQLSVEMSSTIASVELPNHPELHAEISGNNIEYNLDFRVG